MLVITAPSKTQEAIAAAPAHHTTPFFLNRSVQLVGLLKKKTVNELCTLMKMSPRLGEATKEKILRFQLPLTPGNSRQALFTFQGDAYSALTPEMYSEAQLSHAQKHLRILSGLYGILRPLDLMHPYRLEMGLKLAGPGFANLYQFWGELLTERINDECLERGFATLVNLASGEYARSIQPKLLGPKMVTITFKERQASGYRAIPIHAKRARGEMIDFIITDGLNHLEQLRNFTREGYGFAPELSSDAEWVFTRG